MLHHVAIDDSSSTDRRRELVRRAEMICRGAPLCEASPEDAGLLELLADLASRRKQFDFALACLGRIANASDVGQSTLMEFARALRRAGRHAEALTLFERVLALTPEDVGARLELAGALLVVGRTEEAVQAHDAAVQLMPDSGLLLCRIGDQLLDRGLATEALVRYNAALQFLPSDPGVHLRLGRARLALHEWNGAAVDFRRSEQLGSASVDMHVDRGLALLQQGKTTEAVDAFRRSVTIDRAHIQACLALAEGLDLTEHVHEAASAWCCLGAALAAENRFAEAASAYEQAKARNPESLNALVRLGLADVELARPRTAIPRFEAVVAVMPRHSVAHTGLGWSSHLIGDTARGWKEFALDRRRVGEREFDAPEWNGVSPVDGRTILLWADQALGDTIQFARYVALVKRAGARVLLECGTALLPLLERMPCIDRAVARGSPLPAYDLHVPLSALRGCFEGGTTEGDGEAYLSVDEALKGRWKRRLGAPDGRMSVGLVWSGEPTRMNGRAKFAPLSAFAPLASVPNVRFVSLQLGPQLSELLASPPGLTIDTFLTPSSSILDTASLIQNLDLVITVDTMVAHLAGAIGHPVWTLLPFAPDWRWRSEGDSTMWYHSMRLFRQSQADDWRKPLEWVAVELASRNV